MNAMEALEIIVKEAYARSDASVTYRHAFAQRGGGEAEHQAYTAADAAHALAWAAMKALSKAEVNAAYELAEAAVPRASFTVDEHDAWLEVAWKRALKDRENFKVVARARGAR